MTTEDARTDQHADAPVRTGFITTDDGLRIYWRTVGTGPLLICCNGVGVSTFFWKYLTEHFRTDHTILLWDYRGHGRSDRRVDAATTDLSISRHADDLADVIAATGVSGPATVVGHSMGCQVALELRKRHPEHVAGLVLILGTAGRALHTFFDFEPSAKIFRIARRGVMRAGSIVNDILRPLLESPLAWETTTRAQLVDPYYTSREDMLPYLQHLASMDFRVFMTAALATDEHDAWPLLPHLDRPLLVIAGENDKFTPLWCSRKIVDDTPGAELLILADASHAALVEQPETINHRIQRFIDERLPRS